MSNDIMNIPVGVLVSNEDKLSLAEFCRRCSLPAEQVLPLVEYGIVEPIETRSTHIRWQFTNNSVLRAQTALRLQRDLELNLAGAALALELLDEIKLLRGLKTSELSERNDLLASYRQ